MSARELKFDDMNYDTTLAKNFLNQHSKFVGLNCEHEETVKNKIAKEICLGKQKTKNVDITFEEEEITKNKLFKLSQLIERNTELFSQLEYLIRGFQPDELKAFDLKLILQNLLYCSSEKYQYLRLGGNVTFYIKNNSPLVSLARFAQEVIGTRTRIDIVSEPDSAIICWLFVHLCQQAGFGEQICLVFVEHLPVDCMSSHFGDVFGNQESCIVVVSGKADVDSAVDTLVDAPLKGAFGVKRVMVQENVLERFRTALRGKARVCPGQVHPGLAQKSTDAFAINEKSFLVEYAGDTVEGNGEVVVEAYRTVRELISLLRNRRPYALSVWCDSTSESNEIAHSVDANVVWINTFGLFDGPPQVSQMLLNGIRKTMTIDVSDVFKRACNDWQKLSIFERAARLKDLIRAHKIDTSHSFYHVSESFTCAGTEKAAGTFILSVPLEAPHIISHLLTYMVKGGSIAFNRNIFNEKDVSPFYESLKKCGAPVGKTHLKEDGDYIAFTSLAYTQKVVWTSYGTSFAN